MSADAPPSVVIVTGVAGTGKTTVGLALAARLGWSFHDADDLHSPESVDRMRRNVPLDDAQRQPWLLRVRRLIEDESRRGRGAVVACSALKEAYRRTLTEGIPGVCLVLLKGDPAVLRKRLEQRTGHFAGAGLLESQLAALEPPDNALVVNASLPVDAIVEHIASTIGWG